MVSPDITIIWNHVSRLHGEKWETSVEDLQKTLREERHPADRTYVIDLFKEFERQKLGSFRNGRRGQPTRMVWTKKPKELAPAFGSASSPVTTPRIIEHEIPLRSGVFVKLSIPADLTTAEAVRLCEFVKLIPIQ